MHTLAQWDVFCRVVDNYGDIAVSWRLARQLTREHGLGVRLWVDDLTRFHALRPEIDPSRPQQRLEGVEVRQWTQPFPTTAPAEVVIEAFGCGLPADYLAAMAARRPPPVWVNLEYLSAEAWVRGCHGLPSPHPRLPLTCWFFYPGFTAGTGGLMREAGLDAARARFLAAEQDDFWARLGLPPRPPGELRVSLFGYENPVLADLLAQWAAGARPVRCVVPAGRILAAVLHFFGRGDVPPAGLTLALGHLNVHCIPMLPQEDYDRLLWACDLNFVRGEDSLVRALWAERPLVWQAYPQAAGAHRPKLEALLDRYAQDLPTPAAKALRRFTLAWNGFGGALDWAAFEAQLPALRARASDWARQLQGLGDLAGNLVAFCRTKAGHTGTAPT
ncbi:MAG: elongation factor P maturation arginine rhamnosyltransferase EarP [Burkholderiales bacterium]|nr:elongation factor P maturation arginine rhamnosyltransferase EarP [Burkholderiales bacterium]